MSHPATICLIDGWAPGEYHRADAGFSTKGDAPRAGEVRGVGCSGTCEGAASEDNAKPARESSRLHPQNRFNAPACYASGKSGQRAGDRSRIQLRPGRLSPHGSTTNRWPMAYLSFSRGKLSFDDRLRGRR